ncbi:hypothetical protein DMUE_2032 [Dictyocoela muelleri]|nr:hypothetical protein DMUE_2032 [Dictyocoela muelleri]
MIPEENNIENDKHDLNDAFQIDINKNTVELISNQEIANFCTDVKSKKINFEEITNASISNEIDIKKIPRYIKVGDESIDLKPPKMNTLLLFDIDDTLYEGSHDFWSLWFERLKKLLKIKNKPFSIKEYYEYENKYDFALRGYFVEGKITYDEYANDLLPSLPFDEMIPKNLILRDYLISLPYEKWCFTNACEKHAKKALQAIGVEDCFDVIIHCDYVNHIPIYKPMNEAYEFIEYISGAKQIIFFDDNMKNIKTAKKFGWISIKVNPGDLIMNKIREVINIYNLNRPN